MKHLPRILHRASFEAIIQRPHHHRLPEVPLRPLRLRRPLQPRRKALRVTRRIPPQKLHQSPSNPDLVPQPEHRRPQKTHRLVHRRRQHSRPQHTRLPPRLEKRQPVIPSQPVPHTRFCNQIDHIRAAPQHHMLRVNHLTHRRMLIRVRPPADIRPPLHQRHRRARLRQRRRRR